MNAICPECEASLKLDGVLAGEIVVCPDCGVVDSINPGHTSAATKLFDPSPTFTAPAGNILKTGTDGSSNAAPGGFVVRVNMENGTVRTIYEAERPAFSVGERIKLVNGAVIRIG